MNKRSFIMPLFILTVYIIINFFLLRSFWSEIFFDRSQIGAVYGEVSAVEWGLEKLYENILAFKNPFSHTNSLLYPFGLNLINTDSGSGFFFLLLRPFFSTHQSLSIITALSILATNLGMYLVVRKLKFDRLISFLIGLSFGYTTFLMPRVGHITYFSIYVFPWTYYSLISLFDDDNRVLKKIFSAIGFAFFFSLSLYTNLYYFVIILVSLILFFIYCFFGKEIISKQIKQNSKYLFFSFFVTLFFITPWLKILYFTYLFEELPKVSGWGGAIQFSSGIFGYFIPSIYSFFFHPIADFFAKKFSFAATIFENFSYPGLIILFSYFLMGYYLFTKRLTKRYFNLIKPFLFVAAIFWILTLGPFLHVFGKWGLTLDEGIRLVVPLPYIIFHYLPFMANIRVPGRLVIGFIFFSYIVSTYVLSFLSKEKPPWFKRIFFAVVLLVIVIDQYFLIPNPTPKFFPYKVYSFIKNDKDFGTVLEIPSTVRDGFIYFGSGDDIDFMVGQRIYKKPVLGGYFGRIPYYKINYYQRNPFLGYIGRLIDSNLLTNGGLDKNDLEKWRNIDIKKSKASIDFLDIKYILLNNDESYAASLSAIIKNLGFRSKLQDSNFELFTRDSSRNEFTTVNIGSEDDDIYLGIGWSPREDHFRWTGKKTSVMFKINRPRKMQLFFDAVPFYKEQPMSVYVNYHKVGMVNISSTKKSYSLDVDKDKLKQGINFVYFIFKRSYRPKDVLPGSVDERALSVKFTKIYLTD